MGVLVVMPSLFANKIWCCFLLLFGSAALLSYNNNDTTIGVFGFGIQHQQQHQHQRPSLSYSYSSKKKPNTVGSSSSGGRRQTVTQLFAAPQIPKIDEWTILKSGAVQGTVSNHPELPDGYEITTSPLDAKKGRAKNNVIVVTASGSKYKLLTTLDTTTAPTPTPVKKKKPVKKKASLKIPTPVVAAVKQKKKEKVVVEVVENLIDFDFNGKVVGNSNTNKIYLLVGKLIRSSSKRSQIYYAYEGETATANGGNGKGNNNNKLNQNRLTVKISSYPQRLERENKNYNTISNKAFVLFAPLQGSDCCFVKKLDYIANCDTSPDTKGGIPPGSAALVLESGTQNVRVYLEQNQNRGGGLQGSELRKAAVNIVRCVEATHSSGLVWTDLKAENFVLTSEGDVKGIDLESCVPRKANPEDFSPEACPPEFARMEKQGK